MADRNAAQQPKFLPAPYERYSKEYPRPSDRHRYAAEIHYHRDDQTSFCVGIISIADETFVAHRNLGEDELYRGDDPEAAAIAIAQQFDIENEQRKAQRLRHNAMEQKIQDWMEQ